VTESPRINWLPPIVVVGLVVIGLGWGWDRAGYALAGLGMFGALVMAWDGLKYLRRRSQRQASARRER
jgi:threonine/homoserine/homoserine lactone efflux protein